MATSEFYIDNLISLLKGNENVLKAYFGLHYASNGPVLFLAVEQDDGTDTVQREAELLAETYAAGRNINFCSNVDQPEWLEEIVAYNFPFYVKDQPQPLNVAIMKHWFEPELYQNKLLHAIKMGRLVSLFKDFDPEGNQIIFQTYVRNGEEFIPLFSEKDMVHKSGMTEVPKDLTVIEFDWATIDKMVEGNLKEHYYVLNPGTSFEVEFIG